MGRESDDDYARGVGGIWAFFFLFCQALNSRSYVMLCGGPAHTYTYTYTYTTCLR